MVLTFWLGSFPSAMPGKLQGHNSSMGIMYLNSPAHTGCIALYHLHGRAAA